MSYRNFILQIVFRLILITLGIFAILYFSYTFINYIRLFFAIIFTIIAIIELFYYIVKTNRETTQFLEAIIHNDFTQKYSGDKKGKSFGRMYQTFNKVNEKFLEASQHEATEYQYIKMLIEQLKIGVLSYDQKNRIHLANETLKQMLAKNELINLESINKVSPALFDLIIQLNPHENKIAKIIINEKEHHLTVGLSEFKLRNYHYKLVWIQDIRGALDKNEMQAWQKLIRVLTHEIMNSVAPITSLASTLNSMVSETSKNQIDLTQPQLINLNEGLDAIENRSAGLMKFTQAYQSLTRIPLPNIKPVDGHLYFQRIASLFKPTLVNTVIKFEVVIPEGDLIGAFDPDLMEQAIINLLKNAKEAVIENNGSQINLIANNNNGQFEILISDDGGGIPPTITDNIFIPFYTTKNEGSGVGLSLVKQIVHAHNGAIDFSIDLNKGITEFSIRLALKAEMDLETE
jgi:nitrogen fixation/metabolism regulation signal transduction histidine kinase